VDDGRFANNAWIQELPDPITKITWDNAAIISPATAEKLGLSAKLGDGRLNFDNGTFLSIEANGVVLEIPAVIIPGTADGSITIALGYGRGSEGRVGGRRGNYMSHGGWFSNKGEVGFNAYKLRTVANHYVATASVKKSSRAVYKLAVTQEHGALEGRGPDVYRESIDPKFNARDKDWLHKVNAMDSHAEKVDGQGYPESQKSSVGNGCGPFGLHRLLRMHDCLPKREQHSCCRQRAGHRRPRTPLDSYGSLLRDADELAERQVV
jgi:molybdopterin-containing oxidoreductase family iron-sulfur binding subunit